MAVLLSYPGVYVQEVPSGVRTIVGVSTSITMFIGRTGQGPLNKPVRCLNYTAFKDTFSEDVSVGDMARYLRLFFHNGGSDCYVMRIANGAVPAEVTLLAEDGSTPVLRLEAKQPGVWGQTIRAEVSYRGAQPEVTFNLRLFRWSEDNRGNPEQADLEEWINLSMDPNSASYAVDVLTQQSRLVNAFDEGGDAIHGYSLSARPIEYEINGDAVGTAGNFLSAFGDLIADDQCCFEISVDGSGFAPVDLSNILIPDANTEVDVSGAALAETIRNAIYTGLQQLGAASTTVAVTFDAGPAPGTDQASRLLRITSENHGNVFVRPATNNDLAVALMLGTGQGGLEVGAHALRRPAPNGVGLCLIESTDGEPLFAVLAAQPQVESFGIQITEPGGVALGPMDVNLASTGVDEPLFLETEGTGVSPTDYRDGVREKLEIIRLAVNEYRKENADTFHWRAERWGYRLVLLPTRTDDNAAGTLTVTAAGWDAVTADPPPYVVTQSTRCYPVGTYGTSNHSSAGADGTDGSVPEEGDYRAAYEAVEKEVDIFNLLVLPPDRDLTLDMTTLWADASIFCEAQRAFLLMDPPSEWTDAQLASEGGMALRQGLTNDYSAVFYPRLWIREGKRQILVGPSGAIAGLMARIDSSRGVWKAPAGTEANLVGVSGVQYRFSDRENGTLNPRAINTIRVFPNGIVNWGARTNAGDDDFPSDWKYIPIRRLALFMEESLYRGLKWVVFEPNDEPLWAQIRLNVGAFMRNLYRQGAFQGKSPKEAYFVKCDSETTTQDDRNRGIVNIWVGFAPLKPAEFVVLYLQQMAGQIEV